MALLSSHGGKLADTTSRRAAPSRSAKFPQIAIPTAAGTGAEVGRVYDESLDGSKVVAVNLNMVADTVICDPELTLSLPPSLTAATGIDALSHGVETTQHMGQPARRRHRSRRRQTCRKMAAHRGRGRL